MMRTIARPMVVLPEPDSPTSPSVSPRLIVRLTAVDGVDPAGRATQDPARHREPDAQAFDFEMCPPRRTSQGSNVRPPGVEGVADAVADEVDGQHEQHDQDRRRRPLPRLAAQDA